MFEYDEKFKLFVFGSFLCYIPVRIAQELVRFGTIKLFMSSK